MSHTFILWIILIWHLNSQWNISYFYFMDYSHLTLIFSTEYHFISWIIHIWHLNSQWNVLVLYLLNYAYLALDIPWQCLDLYSIDYFCLTFKLFLAYILQVFIP